MFDVFSDTIQGIVQTSGFSGIVWQQLIMIAISLFLVYLAIGKGYEPLLLLPIAFGMLLTNLPMTEMFHMEYFVEKTVNYDMVLKNGGLLDFLYIGVKLGIYPSLIFLGIGDRKSVV